MKKYLLVVALLFIFSAIASAQHKKPNLNIVFIGNSITQGAQLADVAEAPPAIAAAYLQKQKNLDTVSFSNQGHSGYTTLDFLPGTGTFAKVEEAQIRMHY
jgi:lysophospholipase L1-like esterase